MTSDQFRRIALSMEEAVEGEHMNHPDFRVHGKIFATITPSNEFGVVKLTPDQQEQFIATAPLVFSPASGAWGRQGSTMVKLDGAEEQLVREAVKLARLNVTPKRRTKPRVSGKA